MELKKYRADLHIHTVLSPCGDIYMSPAAIVEQAKKLHLDVIAICDHNTTRQVKVQLNNSSRENPLAEVSPKISPT